MSQIEPLQYQPPSNVIAFQETADLLVEGEDESEAPDPNSKPVRILTDFVIFDPKHGSEMISLEALEDPDGLDRDFVAAGRVAAYMAEGDDDEEERGHLRFLMLFRRPGLKPERKAGSSLGACAIDGRDVFFFNRGGDCGCAGMGIGNGDVPSLSSVVDFLLKRDSSLKDKTLRSGGAIGVSLPAVGVFDTALSSGRNSLALNA